MRSQILLAFYGDDFTGSTDALESIASYGAKAVLFLEPPTTKQLEKYPDIQVFGVAGKTRSLLTANMEPELIAAFESIKSHQPLFVHYKVCSTFDSSDIIVFYFLFLANHLPISEKLVRNLLVVN
mgnify:CR=1 FL=1